MQRREKLALLREQINKEERLIHEKYATKFKVFLSGLLSSVVGIYGLIKVILG